MIYYRIERARTGGGTVNNISMMIYYRIERLITRDMVTLLPCGQMIYYRIERV